MDIIGSMSYNSLSNSQKINLICDTVLNSSPADYITTQYVIFSMFYIDNNNEGFIDRLNKLSTDDVTKIFQYQDQGNNGNSFIHKLETNEVMIEAILSRNNSININLKNNEGNTPLMNHIDNNNYPVTLCLLKHGANPFIRNNNGNNSFDIAKLYNNLTNNIYNLLLDNYIEWNPYYYQDLSKDEQIIVNTLMTLRLVNTVLFDFPRELIYQIINHILIIY